MQPISLIPLVVIAIFMERARRINTPAARDLKRLESAGITLYKEGWVLRSWCSSTDEKQREHISSNLRK